ncbi:ABC transporter ATP-binding protein [Anaeroarcus burkinensis]|uniref:ABC transporter ATP-binding protein n=1 Tax=Anaeroarcus burkinensis TaxID=82376 RepID=UPI00040EF39A|nr:ATP-binding cassette domain-containing protein [Anaeroarcus burkinensis]
MLELVGIGKNFDGETVLQGISFRLEPGQTLAVTGPSGRGKTTLLGIASLLQPASEGKILWQGQEVSQNDEKSKAVLRRAHFGYLFQQANLVPALTALENVELAAWLTDKKETGKLKRSEGLLRRLGLGARLAYYPEQLSQGQRRRVSLARALLLQPAFLVADEPTSDLDEETAQQVTEELFAVRQWNGSLLLATHDRSLAAQAQRQLTL